MVQVISGAEGRLQVEVKDQHLDKSKREKAPDRAQKIQNEVEMGDGEDERREKREKAEDGCSPNEREGGPEHQIR